MRIPRRHRCDRRRWNGAQLPVFCFRRLILAHSIESLVVCGCPALEGISVLRDMVIHDDWAGNHTVSAWNVLKATDFSLYVFKLDSGNGHTIETRVHWDRFAGGSGRYRNVRNLCEGLLGVGFCFRFLRRFSRLNVFIVLLDLCWRKGVVRIAFARDNGFDGLRLDGHWCGFEDCFGPRTR